LVEKCDRQIPLQEGIAHRGEGIIARKSPEQYHLSVVLIVCNPPPPWVVR
jgi:hypothetical protein